MNFQPRFLIYPIHQACAFTVEPVFPQIVSEALSYSVIIRPFSGLRHYGLQGKACAPSMEDEAFFGVEHPLQVKDGALEMEMRFPQEDCYICQLLIGGAEAQKFEVYALEEDLFRLNPYRGDNHLHTCMSDGKDSPMYMAAAACRNGSDYCVITDHRAYEPSLTARDFFDGTNVDFLVIPGEEIHSPDNPVHIINLGGNASVTAWWREDETDYRAAVQRELDRMKDVPMSESNKYAAAASQVVFDRVASVDGVSVLCHPNWIVPKGFNEAEDVTDYLFDNRRFTALELIAGGAYEDGTQMQISYYQNRDSMPILGSSDSHGCFGAAGKLEPGNYTIAFAEGLDAESIKAAIRQAHTVAGNANKLYGDFRLVKYAYFLMRNYYEKHQKDRFLLGARMLRLASSREDKDSQTAGMLADPRPSERFALLRYHK